MPYVLIVVVWLAGSHTVTMHDFSSKERCQLGGKKVISLLEKNRRAKDGLFIAASCVEK